MYLLQEQPKQIQYVYRQDGFMIDGCWLFFTKGVLLKLTSKLKTDLMNRK